MTEPVTATMIFERNNSPIVMVHLVTGGHPDLWLPSLAKWRVTAPPPPPPTRAPQQSGRKRKTGASESDHRWPETLLREVLNRLVPTGVMADVPEDGTVRGCFLPFDYPLRGDWIYAIDDYPAGVIITNRHTKEQIDWQQRAPVWGWLRTWAEANGDTELAEQAAAEEMLDALAGR